MKTVPFALGKRPPVRRKAVAFADFVSSPPQHPIVDPAPAFTYLMDGNDVAGDCVVAGLDHHRQTVTGLLTGQQQCLTQQDIWNLYRTQNPFFDPNGTAATNGPGSSADDGMDEQTFLEYLVRNSRIRGFGALSTTDEDEFQAAIYLGLSAFIGVQLTQAQMGSQWSRGKWDFQKDSPSAGGHCAIVIGYDAKRKLYDLVTWGRVIKCTWNFLSHQMDEAWFILMDEHIAHPGFRNSFDLKGFSDAVSELTDGKVIVPTSSAPFAFTKDLKAGMTSLDVEQLQQRLATEPALDGQPCYRFKQNGQLYFGTYFGTNTTQAAIRYQQKHGILPAEGFVGPVTRAALNVAPLPANPPSMLDTFCTAIRDFEGKPGDLNYRNNNPGNFRCSPVGYLPKYGNVRCVGGFAQFPTYELGWEYLQASVLHTATMYPDWTILEFFQHYAPPSDNNPTKAYAANVAAKCGAYVDTTLRTLFA